MGFVIGVAVASHGVSVVRWLGTFVYDVIMLSVWSIGKRGVTVI